MTLDASDLHRITHDEALALVDAQLGTAEEQRSGLLRYRWTSEFQADWKAEVGHWLATARRLGCLPQLVHRCRSRQRSADIQPEKLPNDLHHQLLMNELAPAAVLHYLDGCGWGFKAWDQPGAGIDIDVLMTAPYGTSVAVQVKNPDQPGQVINHRLVDGEHDERVIAAIDKAARQLPRDGADVNVIAVLANRGWPLTGLPAKVISHVVGSSMQVYPTTQCVLPCSRLGVFHRDLAHVGAVLLLDLVRADRPGYAGIALINPWSDNAAHVDWFPHARVCSVEHGVVRWRGTAPMYGALPDGTVVDDEDPAGVKRCGVEDTESPR